MLLLRVSMMQPANGAKAAVAAATTVTAFGTYHLSCGRHQRLHVRGLCTQHPQQQCYSLLFQSTSFSQPWQVGEGWIRQFSTGWDRTALATGDNRSHPTQKVEQQQRSAWWKKLKWHTIARTIKTLRIPFLVLSVFGIGYNQGIIDYARDPKTKEAVLLETVLAGVGAHPSDLVTPDDVQYQQVRRVGQRTTGVAQKYVDSEMNRAIRQCADKLLSSQKGVAMDRLVDSQQVRKEMEYDAEVHFWSVAQRHMDGKWQYVVIKSEIPNAFVSEVLPHRIFVTTAMLDMFIENDDELGLVLGHELSHLILGHVSRSNMLHTFLRTLEVLLLSIDPTEGLASIVVMFFLGTSRSLVGAAYSQENEREADELGIKLAAMACYDTRRASRVFQKMHLHDTESGASVAIGKIPLAGFFDTHPPIEERHEFLMNQSLLENKEKYEDDECQSVKDKLWNILKRANR